jgi:hypothetical protein
VTFELSSDPISARACWCRLCQYIGAGGATVNVAFYSNSLTVKGETRDFASEADSGSRMHRRFCPACGTHLFSEAEPRPYLVFVRAGALDNPEIVQPVATIWTRQAPSWACFDPNLPELEGQPPPVA